MQSDIDAINRAVADLTRRLHRAEATIERLLAEPRRSTQAELVNQTYPRKERPPHYSQGDTIGR